MKPPRQRIEISIPPGFCAQMWFGSFTLILAWSQLLAAHSGIEGIVVPLCGTTPVQNLAGPSESTVNSAGLAAAAPPETATRPSTGNNVATARSRHHRHHCVRDGIDIPTVCSPHTMCISAGRMTFIDITPTMAGQPYSMTLGACDVSTGPIGRLVNRLTCLLVITVLLRRL